MSQRREKMIIVVAPSGGGKSTFINRLRAEHANVADIVTYTTRPPREGEEHGKAYFFATQEEFVAKRDAGFFAEWAQVHSNLYGTPKDQIEEAWQNGRDIIMDVDIQGADSLKQLYPHSFSLFILPPSIDELRRRVIDRQGKAPVDLDLRMQNAEKEIARARDFDEQIVNDEIESSYAEFKKKIEEYLNRA